MNKLVSNMEWIEHEKKLFLLTTMKTKARAKATKIKCAGKKGNGRARKSRLSLCAEIIRNSYSIWNGEHLHLYTVSTYSFGQPRKIESNEIYVFHKPTADQHRRRCRRRCCRITSLPKYPERAVHRYSYVKWNGKKLDWNWDIYCILLDSALYQLAVVSLAWFKRSDSIIGWKKAKMSIQQQ